MSVPSPVLSARFERLSAATDGDACFDAAVALVGHAGQEGAAACGWLVDARPRLPTKLHIDTLEIALVQRASTFTNPALDQFVVSLLEGSAEKEALFYDWYLTATPQLVRPMLARLSRFPRAPGPRGDLIRIPLVTARPSGQVRLSSVFRRCREALTRCASDPDPAVSHLASVTLDILAGRPPRNEPVPAAAPLVRRFVGQPRSDTLLVAGATAVYRLSVATREPLDAPCHTPTEARCLALSLDGSIAAWVRGLEGTVATDAIEICRRNARTPERKIDVPAGSVVALAFSAGGATLALMGESSTRMVDIQSGRQTRLPAKLITYASKDDLAAITTAKGSTQLWRMATGDLVHTVATQGPALALAFSPDGAWLASVTATELALTECATGRRAWSSTCQSLTAIATGIHFSPDGQRLSCQRTPTTLAVWERRTGALVRELPVDISAVTGLFLRGNDLIMGARGTLEILPL